MKAQKCPMHAHIQNLKSAGADPGFSEGGGGSESGVDIEGGANPSIVSLKQGVWGAQPPRSYGVFNFG